jgi:apoptosis-inducing factor 2
VIPFDYCVYALGSRLPAPIDVWGENENVEEFEENVDVLGEDEDEAEAEAVDDDRIKSKGKKGKTGTKKEGIRWLKRGQKKIKDVNSVLVVGGGALGIRKLLINHTPFSFI